MFVEYSVLIFAALASVPSTLCIQVRGGDPSKHVIESTLTECGRTTPRLEPMAIGGAPAQRGELPWHVGVYRRTSSPYRLICGGSIVSRNVVLSAAHCFWDLYFNVAYPASHFAVAAGKIYRPWLEKEPSAQSSLVEELIIPESFRGADRNFADDIAMAVLSQSFEFKPYLRPVCLDFDAAFEETQLRNGNQGKIAGWGLVSDSGHESPLLRTVELPFMDITVCLSKTPSSYWEVLGNDKFCAGYTDGLTALCKGDSGGGLVFPSQDAGGVTRYYLRGVVSSSPSSNKKCNSRAVTSFTLVSRYGNLIRQKVAGKPVSSHGQAPPGSCILPPFPDNGKYVVEGNPDAVPGSGLQSAIISVTCDSGYQINGLSSLYCINAVWQADMPTCYDCGRKAPQAEPLIVNGTRARLGEVPWHAGVYLKAKGEVNKLLCGGTIISTTLVVTAAHCLWDQAAEALKPASNFAIGAGKLYRAWTMQEPTAQYSDVVDIGVPRRFLGITSNFAEDIAVLVLATGLRFRPYLRPVCLDRTRKLEAQQLKTGNEGMIAGWGLTDVEQGGQAKSLLVTQLPYKSFDTCLKETPESFKAYYTSDKICAGVNGTAICKGDSGGGLAFPRIDARGVERYYLRGVASTGPRTEEFCSTNTNTYYTKVSRHTEFLDRYLSAAKNASVTDIELKRR